MLIEAPEARTKSRAVRPGGLCPPIGRKELVTIWNVAEVIVLGGYGTVGSACVRELIETTRAGVLVAGRSVQRAEEAALAAGKPVRGIYANATDPRTMRALLPGAAAVVCCTGSGTPDALALALEHRIPFVDLEPIALKPEIARELGERAWSAQIPVVLGAGAVPGLPGVLAEYLVRRLTECDWIHVASTGPWRGSTAADRDIEQLWKIRRPGSRLDGPPTRWRFADPIGSWSVRPAPAIDLEGFSATHCVEELAYLEVEPGPLTRIAQRIFGRHSEPRGFAVSAEGYGTAEGTPSLRRVEIRAGDVIEAAAIAVGAVVRGILEGQVPAGLLTQREALNPSLLLNDLQKRGLEVSVSE